MTAVAKAESAAVEPGIVLLATDAMRARRRPFAILAVWAWETVLALVLSWPVAGVIRETYGGHPQGDGVLWNPGAYELTDLFDHTGSLRTEILGQAGIVCLVALLAGLFPLGALLTSLAHATRERRAPGAAATFGGAIRAFLPLLLLFIVALILQAVLLFVGLLASDGLASATEGGLGEARAQQLGILTMLLFLLLVWAIGVAHDLARAAVVRHKRGFRYALRAGVRAFRKTPLVALWSWAWRALAGLVPIVIGSLVADKLGGKPGVALAAVMIVHQGAVLARVALRASWLAKALRLVDAADDTQRAHPG